VPSTPTKSQRLRIVVTGLAATYPFGGVFWDYIQYVLGFHRLGHDVLYLEDTGKWCYDPVAQSFVADASGNAARLQAALAALDPALKDRWFLRDAAGETYGRSWADVVRFVREADLFLHISASCWMRDEYFACKRIAFIDSDPMYTQGSVPGYLDGTASEDERGRIDMLRRHDVFFTFAENLGGRDCRIPLGIFDWKPTRQPVVLSCFEPHGVPLESRRRNLTTVASWEPTEKGPTFDGVMYTGKSTEFLRFQDLPSRSALPLEIALSGPAPVAMLRSKGWKIREAWEVTSDPWIYRSYLANSLAEWSVAKNAYAAGRTGWFSCRSACYLALGVPVVVQDTGFGAAIPTGEGIVTFRTLDEAAAAIDEVASNPERHARAAAEIARELFDSDKVLTALLEQAMATSPGSHDSRRTTNTEIESCRDS
jgi:hypothetical protein